MLNSDFFLRRSTLIRPRMGPDKLLLAKRRTVLMVRIVRVRLPPEKRPRGARMAQQAVPSFEDRRDVTLFTRQRGRLSEPMFSRTPIKNGFVSNSF